MMSSWPLRLLEDVTQEVLDRRGVTPLKLGSMFKDAGHRVISAKVVKDGTIDLSADEPRFVDDATYTKWMRTPLQSGDVILTSEAPLGQAAYLRQKVDWCLGQRLFAIRAKQSILDGRFLYYAIQSNGVRNDILSRASGTTVHGIRQSELRKVAVPVPPLSTQRAIASILGSLDDKIELNRMMSATLEAIVRALFKSWFVDFDPVHAKAEGRDPGLPAEIAALFPKSFDESKVEEIPSGWCLSPLSALSSSIQRGFSPAYTDVGVLVINQKCIRDGLIDLSRARRHDSSIKSVEGRTVHHGDVLINSTGVGTLGRVAPVVGLPVDEVIVDSHVTIVRPNPTAVEPTYLGAAILRLQSEIERLGEGTTGQTELSRARLGALLLATPPRSIQERFACVVEPLLLQIAASAQQSKTLAALRDLLLPKLISGELRVGDAERVLAVSA